MIPERNSTQVVSTVEGEDIAMRIDENALAHIMNVLTDLYEDPELAIIREYSTNALDSHVAAGQDRPIEVSLPTVLRPLFTVRDYGVGLDADDIREIYSAYGASTKRETNDAVGMLGLGCKSALAYVDQFTVVGIKNGERVVVSVSRDETGAGVMTTLESTPTNEPTGVEITVPTKGADLFAHKAAEFFRFWDDGTVLVDGEAPERAAGWQIDDEFSIIDRRVYDPRMLVVMGGVSYPVPADYANGSDALLSLPVKKQLIARVPIGMVSFTPSREALQDHPATRAALDQILATFRTAAERAIRDQVGRADDKPSAARALIAARDALGAKNVPNVVFGGEVVPTVVSAENLPGADKENRYGLWDDIGCNGRRGRKAAGQVSLDDAAAFPWIVGYTNKTWTRSQRQKFNRYLRHHGYADYPDDLHILITDAPGVPLQDWLGDDVLSIEWSKVRDWKDPERPATGGGGRGKYAGTYDVYLPNGLYQGKHPADELPKSGRNLYYTVSGGGAGFRRALGPKAIVVDLPPSRKAKFLRLFPHARCARTVATAAAERWWARQPRDRKIAHRVNFSRGHSPEALASLPADKLNDPDLARWIKIVQLSENEDKDATYRKYAAYIPDLYKEYDPKDYEKFASTVNKYPLIDNYTRALDKRDAEHAVLYANAVYAADKE